MATLSRIVSQADPAAQQSLSFREFVSLVHPRYQWYRHCEELAEVLQQVADGAITRLMVFLPPRHSKSETVSRLFSAYYVYRHPDRFVGLASYAAGLASTLSRAARDRYRMGAGTVRDDVRAVEHWETTRGGGMWAAGVGGPITGKGCHLGIIDDPLKNDLEAASETIREHHKEWYRSTFSSRLEPDAALIVVQTRWHEDDLAGYLLSQEYGEDADHENWTIVHLPAIAEDELPDYPANCPVHPDWRATGEALCPERYNEAALRRKERTSGPYFWAALYQQRPAPRSGGMFGREWFEIVGVLPVGCTGVRYWDKAGTAGGTGARTAGVLMARAPDGAYYVIDVIADRLGSTEREALIKQTAILDRQRTGIVIRVWLEQEPGSGGKESAENTVRMLAAEGIVAEAETVRGDKTLRAEPLASMARVKNVRLVRGTWNAGFLEELATFPNGKLKDKVDAASGAFNKLAQTGQRAGVWVI